MNSQRQIANYETVTTWERFDYWLKAAWDAGYLSFDTETTGLDVMTCELVGLSMSITPGSGCYIPLSHIEGDQLPIGDVLEKIAPLLVSPGVLKIMHNAKFDINVLYRYGVILAGVEDSMLMSASMYGGKHRHNMDDLAKQYLNYTTIKFKEVTDGAKLTFDEVPIDTATDYAAEDSDITLRLAFKFRNELDHQPGGLHVYSTLEQPLIGTLARMERAGISVDVERLQELSAQFGDGMDAALDKAVAVVGHEFNPGSPQQVGAVLQAAGVELTELTDTGQPATGVKVLEDVVKDPDLGDGARELIGHILEWRKLAKLKGTYADALVDAVNPATGRVHPSFHSSGTGTGRLSCSDPNLQNIPIRTAEGKQIRGCFIAKPGHKLISADYSQIELRILAHACGDEALLEAFDTGADIHATMAGLTWNMPVEDVDADLRRRAKSVSFGIIYGTTAWGMSRNMGIPVERAEDIIRDFFAAFPGVKDYMDRATQMARRLGFVETLAGRRIWFPDIRSNQNWRRGHAERAAVNAPIQGTAADIIKAAMLKVDRRLQDAKMETTMLLQVHDELVFEAPDAEADEALSLITETMQSAVDYLDVPLLVEGRAADDWEAAH